MSKQPFLPLFFGDLLASTAEWEGEERSLYLLLLGYQWSLGSLPIEPRRICKLVGYSQKNFDACWPTVSEKFTERDGRLINPRLEDHRERANEISNKRANAGAKGGATTQAKLKQMLDEVPSKTEANATNLLGHPIQTIPNHTKDTNQEKDLGGDARGDASPSAPPERKQPSDRATRIPADFELNDQRIAVATAEKLPDIPRTFAKFCDYWRAASGAKARKIDWDATWRNWCRSEADRGVNGSGTRPQQPYKTKFDQAMEALDRA